LGESAPVDAYCRHEDTGHWECLSDVPPQGSLAAGRACPPLTNSHVVRLGCSVVCVCVHACVAGCWVLFRQPVVWCTDFLCPPPAAVAVCPLHLQLVYRRAGGKGPDAGAPLPLASLRCRVVGRRRLASAPNASLPAGTCVTVTAGSREVTCSGTTVRAPPKDTSSVQGVVGLCGVSTRREGEGEGERSCYFMCVGVPRHTCVCWGRRSRCCPGWRTEGAGPQAGPASRCGPRWRSPCRAGGRVCTAVGRAS